jgi:adenylate cyclase
MLHVSRFTCHVSRSSSLMSSQSIETPATYIPIDRRLALAEGRELAERAQGAALFADISGFTPLTEMLARELGPQRGAEELTVYLNRVYDCLITELHNCSGAVIGFSGDAITCWFDEGTNGSQTTPRQAALRAVAAAVAMQQAMQQFSALQVAGGGIISLALKTAVAAGSVRRFVAGNPRMMLVDVIAGATLERLAAVDHQAEQGEVVLDEETAISLGDTVQIATWRTDADSGQRFAVVAGLIALPSATPWPALPPDGLTEEQTRPWLLPPVYRQLQAGQAEFLAELRPAVALFLRFAGIDYDGDSAAPQKLDQLVRQVQEILARYEGNLLQLTIGDKGSYLYGAFGAPIAHEDDVDRAAAAALEMQELPAQLDFLSPLQIGIAYGRMRTGAYGSLLRRTYGVLGDATNLSARLMQVAQPGEILVSDQAQQRASPQFVWQELPAMPVKGKRELVTPFRLVEMKSQPAPHLLEARYALPMVGREAELNLINERLAAARQGLGQIVAIMAETGMGKSRLLAEVVQWGRQQGFADYLGECQSFATNTSYHVWQPIWRGLFGLQAEEMRLSPAQQIERVAQELHQIDPALIGRMPLLNKVLNLAIPDNDLTGSLSAKLRKSARETLLTELAQAKAEQQPLLLVLEDCHWLDPMSLDLLTVIGRTVANLPVCLLLVYRPLTGQESLPVTRLPYFTEVGLTEFTEAEAERLIGLKVTQRFGETAELPSALFRRIIERSRGNPFFIDELINYLQDQNLDLHDTDTLAQMDLPGSLHSLILSRMDQLSEDQKTTLKIASVIGRTFPAAALWGVYPQLGPAEQIRANLSVLCDLELTPLDTPEPELTYIFKHVVIQEVAYESLLYRTRAMLHEAIGRYLETYYPDDLDQQIHLLAHHFGHSENEAKKREYLLRAADQSRADYANSTAIDYYRRVLPLLPRAEQPPVLRRLGMVYELLGEWQEAERRYRQALSLANELGDVGERAWCETAMAELLRKQGQYEQARTWLDKAYDGFTAVSDQAGIGQVLHYAGTIADQRGDYEQAQGYYERSLSIRQALGDERRAAYLLGNLGIVARRQGQPAQALTHYQESLALRRALGDRWGVANCLNNMGNVNVDLGRYQAAQAHLEESLAIQRELGDRWMIGNAINNLGNVARAQSDYERSLRLYRESLDIYGALQDKWALAYLFEDLGWLLAKQNQGEAALKLVAAASVLRQEIGAPLTASESEKLNGALAEAIRPLSQEAQHAATQAGQTLTLSEAILYAFDRIDRETTS